MLVSVQNVTKGFLDATVLRRVSLDIEPGDRIGLLGVNGAGKTTLLNLIAGRLEPDEGVISRQNGLEIGYLRQNDALEGARTIQEEARGAFAKTNAVKAEMDDVCLTLEAQPEDQELLARYDKLTAQFEAMDGYHVDDKISRVLTGLGFGGFARDTRVQTLSGGEKMRFSIAKMLLREPGLLMLDEPTNHLDFSMLGWLEDYLQTYKGAVLLVSHDRYFLNSVAKDTCEIERCELTRYTGGYTSFVVQKAERRRAAEKAYEKQQVEIAHMEDYIRKNLVRASTTKMAQSRRTALEKMERLPKPRPEQKTISLRFDYDLEPFSTVLTCKGLGVSVGEGAHHRRLYESIELEVRREEKIALVGMNGVGKSTFLKAVQNLVEHEGLVRWGGNVRLGYFDQELAGLDMDMQVLEAVHSQYPTKTELEIRTALGRMLIEGEAVYKKVRELSGANRAKVAFAILLMRRANVLLLDEPTNHLDYRAKEALEEALRSFGGTLIAVSHDRYFLQRVPTRILEMRPEGFVNYPGNYDDYKAAQGGGVGEGPQNTAKGFAGPEPTAGSVAPAEKPEAKTGQGRYRSKQQRAEEAQARTRIATLEKEVARLEAAIEAANAALADPANASIYELLQALSEQLRVDTAALDEKMDEWLEVTGG